MTWITATEIITFVENSDTKLFVIARNWHMYELEPINWYHSEKSEKEWETSSHE